MSTKHGSSSAARLPVIAAVALALSLPASASWGDDVGRVAHEGDAIADIVQVLRDQGLIDAATETKILAKSERRAAAASSPRLLEGFEWFGDLRIRNEQFWFDRDINGVEPDNRNRFRYRLRFGFKRRLNDWLTVGVRLASGVTTNSTNVSFGDSSEFPDPDFGNDAISIDEAYLRVALPEPDGMDLETSLVAGKFSNPFTWKNGEDYLIFDNDITPEGFYLTSTWRPSEQTSLFATLGYYVIDENSSTKNPKILGAQLGGQTAVADGIELGLRGSWYEWRSLDDGFIGRTAEFGSLRGAYNFGEQQAQVGELFGFARVETSSDWPALVYGQVIRNFNAEDDPRNPLGPVDAEDQAYGFGFEVGSSKKLFKAGFGWFHVEANATPALITDSDLFDAHTNREGYMAYFEKVLFKTVTFKLTLFDGQEIEDDPPFGAPPSAGSGSDRRRLQSDFSVRF